MHTLTFFYYSNKGTGTFQMNFEIDIPVNQKLKQANDYISDKLKLDNTKKYINII